MSNLLESVLCFKVSMILHGRDEWLVGVQDGVWRGFLEEIKHRRHTGGD